ncbi:hypothetical protein ACJIZ3_002622 [Penstemon smallii]|uniref:HMA domain-containing protein n=1 Tax=Penstemon smallii TaxID=265156 RepID=A0ABD3U6W4_9LAMI
MDYAEAICVLKVHVHCPACKMRMMEVLGSICGVYNVDINAEKGMVVVSGAVDPNILMKALARTGYHAEVKSVKLRHPELNKSYYNSYYDYGLNSYGYGHSYGAFDDPYRYGRALPDHPFYDVGHSGHYYSPKRSASLPYYGSNPYYNGSSSYYHGMALPHARLRPFAY